MEKANFRDKLRQLYLGEKYNGKMGVSKKWETLPVVE